MEKIFQSLKELDIRAEQKFDLRDGVLMEHAAMGMSEHIRTRVMPMLKTAVQADCIPCIQIVCGSGDNGGDGLVLARLLSEYYSVRTVLVKEPRSPLALLQKKRLELLDIPIYSDIETSCTVLVDAVLGTGLNGTADDTVQAIVNCMNDVQGYKIACDIPTGLNVKGIPSPVAFHADETHSMGALKEAFYSDMAKDYTGEIFVVPLGLPRIKYEDDCSVFLLSKNDMRLPVRTLQNTHKMSYGHAVFFCGEKQGACFLAASAALHFGSGMVSLYGENIPVMDPNCLYTDTVPEFFSVCCVGSGLGRNKIMVEKALCFLAEPLVRTTPIVLDADILHLSPLRAVLPHLTSPILTPHPKEFQSILANTGLAKVSVEEIQHDRFHYARLFCRAYPHAVLILKGAYPLIAQNDSVFVNPFCSNALAKAGSGDVLAGLTAALAGQHYAPLQAAITASLAHAAAARLLHDSYGITASELAAAVSRLSYY